MTYTYFRDHSDRSVLGVANAVRVKVRTMQMAHVVWWRWLRLLAKMHLDHPELTANQVLSDSLLRAPSKETRNMVKPLFPQSP